LTGVKKSLFFWALDLGLKYELDSKNGAWYEIQLKLARKIIFSKWKEAMGGNVLAIGVGGAALQRRLEKVFWAAGIKLLNMYGLTETSPVITINRKNSEDMMLGTVGRLLENIELRLLDDGEILCRGPNVMLGYYKDEKATKEAIDEEGWFHTGDVGELVNGKFLRITDRKKELFKLSNGKFVSPQCIENRFKESIFIDQLMVIGEGEKHASALISPNFEELKVWCNEKNIADLSPESIVANEEVLLHYRNIVKDLNSTMGKDEQINRFKLVKDEWTPLSGELSPTLKLKRAAINNKYRELITQIFDRN
jgi:long-chain acyl-CoA synthetase